MENFCATSEMGNLAVFATLHPCYTGLTTRRLKLTEFLSTQLHERELSICIGIALQKRFVSSGRRKAEGLGVQELKTRKRVIGLEHPDTLTNLANPSESGGNCQISEITIENAPRHSIDCILILSANSRLSSVI